MVPVVSIPRADVFTIQSKTILPPSSLRLTYVYTDHVKHHFFSHLFISSLLRSRQLLRHQVFASALIKVYLLFKFTIFTNSCCCLYFLQVIQVKSNLSFNQTNSVQY